MATLINNELVELKGKYLIIGTAEINAWTDGKPFTISCDTESDLERNGFTRDEYEGMKVGEVRHAKDYEGITLVRIA